MVKINGMSEDVAGMTIGRYLDVCGYSRKKVAVEINDVIVPKAEYDSVKLQEEDVVELVSFVGGG